MWPFKKNKVIDLTEKKIKLPKIIDESEYKDLTKNNAENESALGFLGSMASASSNSSFTLDNPLSLQHLKVKIEDIEYKINSLRNRIDKILDRLDLAEKKIDRELR